MLNNVTLVGRLTSDLEINEVKNGENEQYIITLAVSRSCKNAEGVYETDFIPCYLCNGIVEGVQKYCHKGDAIGVRGRLQIVDDKLVVIVERVQFLKSGGE